MKKLLPVCYNGFAENINETKKTPHYFAASNSSKGFVSYFSDVFGEDIKRLYILLGGPGSGKSTMMKNVADISEKEGYTTERIHCSSSPFSLDGVIIREKSTAVIDGTNPHTYNITLPGVREITIDPGLAWDTDGLFEKRDEIASLSDKKKTAYKRAYLYLKAQGILSQEMNEMTRPYILEQKLLKNIDLQIKNSLPKKGEKFSCSVMLQRGITGAGNIYFESLIKSAEKKILVKDCHGISEIYFRNLYRRAVENKAKIAVSYSPENPDVIDGILFRDSSVCYSLYCDENECDKIINCERFENKTGFMSVKQKYAFAEKCRCSIGSQVFSALSEASKTHDLIEKEYAEFTDYSVTEKISSELCQRIF
jgi:hypothetical protein